MYRPERLKAALLAALLVVLMPIPMPVAAADASPVVTQASSADVSQPRWTWPLTPVPAVTRPFDLPHPYAAGHRGIDLDAVAGAVVLAPEDGVVRFAGWVVDRPVLSLQHADGLISTYEPVVTTLTVGTVVARGEVIGTLDSAVVHAPAGGLHLGARMGDGYLDPLALLGLVPRAVLLPLG